MFKLAHTTLSFAPNIMSTTENGNQSGSVEHTDLNVELVVAASRKAASTAISAGDRAPLFSLEDKRMGLIALEDLLLKGPVIVQFRRGAWCSYGDHATDAVASVDQSDSTERTSVVVIEPPCRVSVKYPSPALPVLLDANMAASRSYGLAFELPQSLRAYYYQLGYTPPQTIEKDTGLVPLSATYVIDRDGIVIFSYIDVDYRKHCGCKELVDALKAAQTKRTGKFRTSLVAS